MGMSIEEYRNLSLNGNVAKNENRQIQGKANRSLGKNFEEQVEILCEIYKLNKLAIVEKTPEPMKILKHIESGRFETVFTKVAQPDFKGTIKGGRTVVFDAKYTESNKITYQALSENQRETLLAYDELGAMAFVLVGFSNGEIYHIDIKIWENMKKIFGVKHIKLEELEKGNFKSKKLNNGIVDFLGICEKI